MATAEVVDTFLQAEEQASQLVEELTRLKAEAESYEFARLHLDQSGKEVGRLASELTVMASEFKQMIETLRSIGTPELLRQHEDAKAQLAALRESVTQAHAEAGERLATQQGQLSALLRTTAKDIQTAVCTDLAATTAELSGAAKDLEGRVDRIGQVASAARTLGIVTLVAVGALAIAVSALAIY
jgi:chromosome segregation ATPase